MSIITPDYYETLELPRSATQEDIKEAYRNLSLRFHPSKATSSLIQIYEYKFHKIAEAYSVLSDPYKKGIYDNYGKNVLYNGIRDKEGNIKGAYKYTGNAMEIFNDFMDKTNPFSLIREPEKMNDKYKLEPSDIIKGEKERINDEYGSIFNSAYGGMNEAEKKKLDDINIDLHCTLEEFYNGTVKYINYKKNTLNYDQRTFNLKDAKIKVEIFPGYSKETVLKFPYQGNEAPGQISSDLIIHLKEIPHEKYRRVNKDDLLYIHDISLSDALNSSPIDICTLDGRKIKISMDEIISPKSIKVVSGEGMPSCDMDRMIENYIYDGKKGDLYIKFNIKFPEYINGKKKDKIVKLLSE